MKNLRELGKKMREEQQRVQLLQEEGYKMKLEQINEGRKKREEKKVHHKCFTNSCQFQSSSRTSSSRSDTHHNPDTLIPFFFIRYTTAVTKIKLGFTEQELDSN